MNSGNTADDNSLPQPAHWKFWGTLAWGAVIGAVFYLLQIAAILWAVASRRENKSESEFRQLFASAVQDGDVLSLAVFATTVVCCGLILGAVRLKKHSNLREYLAIRPVTLKTMLNWIGLLAVLIVLSEMLTRLLGRPVVPNFVSAMYATANHVWMIWFALIVAGPIFEEMFFRGFLYRGLESSFLGTIGTVMVTAGLWAVIHLQYDLYGIATIFGVGVLFGAARAFTGSLLVPLGLHSAANLVSTAQAAILL